MRILIDIGHPAHVHLFKNFAWQMQNKGHKILFTAREKEHETYLLKKYGFDFTVLGIHYNNTGGKLFGLFKFNLLILFEALKFKPDIFLSHGSIYAAHVSSLFRKPHVSLEDTGNREQIVLYKPFTDVILTPRSLSKELGRKQIRYDSYHEFAYLLPKYFQPDNSVFEYLGLEDRENFVLLRFSAWKATHDVGHAGLSIENKIKAVKQFSKYAKVFVSSESSLPKEMKKYQIRIPPERMHDVLYYADLLYSESATMASECALLGTPSIFLDNTGRDYTKDQENKYGLVFNYTESEIDQKNSIEKAIELLSSNNIKEEWQRRRKNMLNDMIDLTGFLVWFVENYPESKVIIKENPEYQNRFKP